MYTNWERSPGTTLVNRSLAPEDTTAPVTSVRKAADEPTWASGIIGDVLADAVVGAAVGLLARRAVDVARPCAKARAMSSNCRPNWRLAS